MNENQQAKQTIQPAQSTQPNIQNKQDEIDKPPSNLRVLGVGLVLFVVGVVCGVLLFVTYPNFGEESKSQNMPTEKAYSQITLPDDAVKIQECVDGKGSLYARSGDIPMGPIYMVYKGKAIGVEYEVRQDELASAETFLQLNSTLKIDHITAGFVSDGQELTTDAKSYFALYTVDKATQSGIKCPRPTEQNASSSAGLSTTPEASEEAKTNALPEITEAPTQGVEEIVLPTNEANP